MKQKRILLDNIKNELNDLSKLWEEKYEEVNSLIKHLVANYEKYGDVLGEKFWKYLDYLHNLRRKLEKIGDKIDGIAFLNWLGVTAKYYNTILINLTDLREKLEKLTVRPKRYQKVYNFIKTYKDQKLLSHFLK